MFTTRTLFALGLSVAVAQAQNGTTTCCNAIQKSGLENVLYRGDIKYEDRIESYWSLSAHLHPSCFVQPTSTDEVVKIVKTLVNNSLCAETEFAVRSGGHMPWKRSNNLDNGVTIDLGLMNSTTLNETSQTAHIQPGARWGVVYSTLEKHNYTVAGGRAHDVGVGGFVGGGGNTFFANRFGFGVDNVKNFEIVLASGEVVNANINENSDLYLVLKGGVASNYGVVTRVDMHAIQSSTLWGGVVVYDRSTIPQHIEAHTSWVDEVGDYPPASTVLAFTYSKAWGNVTVVNFYEDTTGVVAPPAFNKYLAIPQVNNTLRLGSHANMASEIDIPYNYHHNLHTLAVHNDPRIYTKLGELHSQLIEEWKTESNDTDFLCEVNFQAIPRTFTEHGLANGGNIMGLDRVYENVTMVLLLLGVREELQEKAIEKIHTYGEQMEDFAASLDGLVQWKHLNYAGGYQNPLATYGEENVAKMKAASKKYDPSGIFQTKSSPGYKISNV